ncbi:hypothetical protein NMY22_g13197 [Coprinellus aureogranulatus]|nr:hypothetical protein NMY22_g13197 [Coprinellus aureogranulatus]
MSPHDRLAPHFLSFPFFPLLADASLPYPTPLFPFQILRKTTVDRMSVRRAVLPTPTEHDGDGDGDEPAEDISPHYTSARRNSVSSTNGENGTSSLPFLFSLPPSSVSPTSISPKLNALINELTTMPSSSAQSPLLLLHLPPPNNDNNRPTRAPQTQSTTPLAGPPTQPASNLVLAPASPTLCLVVHEEQRTTTVLLEGTISLPPLTCSTEQRRGRSLRGGRWGWSRCQWFAQSEAKLYESQPSRYWSHHQRRRRSQKPTIPRSTKKGIPLRRGYSAVERKAIGEPQKQRLRLLRPRSDFESPTPPNIGGGDPGDNEDEGARGLEGEDVDDGAKKDGGEIA